jgi:hypothetical protein
MTKSEVIRALRLFHYDPEWRVQRRGKRMMHAVPMRGLGKVAGVSYVQIYAAVVRGVLSDRACAKLAPFVEKMLKGEGKFVFLAKKGYVFVDGVYERIGGRCQ